MASVVLRVLALTLGLFFVFVGIIKLTPSINTEIYKEMVSISVGLEEKCDFDIGSNYRTTAVPAALHVYKAVLSPEYRLVQQYWSAYVIC